MAEPGDLKAMRSKFLRAVDDVSFEIKKGETFALVGESGSGKSTVAKMVVGLIPPTQGEISIENISMTDPAQVKCHAVTAAADPDDLSGPVCQSQSTLACRPDSLRTDPRF